MVSYYRGDIYKNVYHNKLFKEFSIKIDIFHLPY